MKARNLLVSLFSSIILLSGCAKSSNPVSDADDSIQLQPKNQLISSPLNISTNIEADAQGNIWYAIAGEDTTVYVPPTSSYLPVSSQLCMFDGTSHRVKYDGIKASIHELTFDKNGNIWLINSSEVMTIDSQHVLSKVLELPDDEKLLQSITVDRDNNVWVGGLNTGIFRYSDRHWTRYTTANSQLPTNSITKIFTDETSAAWIALWDLSGILKIANSTWTIHSSANSNVALQDIWDLKVDHAGHLWVGTGFINPKATLLEFDGATWKVNNPRDEAGNDVPGAVRHIEVGSNGDVWTVSEEVENSVAVRTTLSVFDGQYWSVLENVSENKLIRDIEAYANKVFVATNDEIYVVEQ